MCLLHWSTHSTCMQLTHPSSQKAFAATPYAFTLRAIRSLTSGPIVSLPQQSFSFFERGGASNSWPYCLVNCFANKIFFLKLLVIEKWIQTQIVIPHSHLCVRMIIIVMLDFAGLSKSSSLLSAMSSLHTHIAETTYIITSSHVWFVSIGTDICT